MPPLIGDNFHTFVLRVRLRSLISAYGHRTAPPTRPAQNWQGVIRDGAVSGKLTPVCLHAMSSKPMV